MAKLFHIDSFTNEIFKGNPAGVCLLDRPATAAWMQNVASEMNLSETAFVNREGEGFRLRWFTPTVEINLCGHATLAAAHAMWSERMCSENATIRFETLSGLLTARKIGNEIELNFPLMVTNSNKISSDALATYKLDSKIISTSSCSLANIIELESLTAVQAVAPDFSQMAIAKAPDLIVTARGESKVDFVSRFFAPSLGIPEDPVTGAAHCALADFWSKKLNKQKFSAFQASKRGGYLGVEIEGKKVLLRGQAVTFSSTEISAY